MKKFGIVIFIALFAALLTVAASARTVSFKPLTDEETSYVQEISKEPGKDNGNWFFDKEQFIVYKFPVTSKDLFAKLTLTVGAQYKISASNDNKEYKVIDEAVKPADAKEDWGAERKSRTYNLASFLTGEAGFIYIKIEDAQSDNGWGPYIVSADRIVFTTSVAAGQSYSFKPFSDDEKKYLVEVTKDAGKGGDDRFLDGKNYIIYRFPVSAHDKYAQFTAKIGAQYKISASVDNVNYKVMEEAVKPADAKPDWGANRELRNVNVSEFITAYDGYIYIKIEDAQNDNGWGPYIVTANGIKFTTIAPVGLQKLVDVESIDAQAGFSENESAPSIFDGNSKTKYCLPNPTPVITWKMKEAVSVGSYKFTTANDSPERTPKSWTFYGSNDGTTWTVLSKIEGAAMPTDFFTDSKSYIVNNHDKFTFFKLEITSVFGGDLCQFSEFKFFPAP